MTPQQRQRRRGLAELVLGMLCTIVLLTAAEGAPAYVVPVTAVGTIFLFGAAYSDIRGKASAAHKRLDKMDADTASASAKLDITLTRITDQVTQLRIDLAARGVVGERDE